MVEIQEVNQGSSKEKEFLKFADKVYQNDKNWVKPLNQEMLESFDTLRNPFFKNGEARRWVLKSDDGCVGRIEAFINYQKKSGQNRLAGGIGFFEVSPCKSAAFKLFDTCKEWFKEKGVEFMDGPINFGENDNNWGLLVKGFTQPSYGMNYNPKYYQSFFEEYGFEPLYEQYTNHYDLKKPLPQRFKRIGQRVLSNTHYEFKHFKLSQVEILLKDLEVVYNQAWKDHQGFQPIDYDYLFSSFKKMKSFLKEDLIWFAYADDRPIGFIVGIPDINQHLKPLNGKLNLLSMFKLCCYRLSHKINKLRVIIMGIVPEYQNKGIESALITHFFESVTAYKQYHEAELSWVGSFNPKMLALHRASGATHGKTHITYRYHLSNKTKKIV